MSDDTPDDSVPLVNADREVRELMGLFDLPAFARRGQDMEYSVNRVHVRCRVQRDELLEMVRMRLRQWTRVAAGPQDWSEVFTGPIDSFWNLVECEPLEWAALAAARRQRLTVARDLVGSVQRFNQRWVHFLGSLNLGPTNQVIDQYNEYYVLEKECVMGSARLAARHFTRIPRLSPESLLERYPTLPVPELWGR
jgi:hypothetical protein